MSAPRRVVTFTSLWPSPGQPHHGSFVQERMLRAVEGQDDLELVVVSPVAQPPAFWPGTRARLRGAPEVETRDGIAVHRPRYFHLPGMSLRAQAGRVARAALPVVARLVEGRSAVVDAHYVYPDGVAAVRIARALGVPCIVTARGTDVNVIAAREVVAGQVREAMAQATRCFAVSDALRRRFAEVAGLDAARVEVLRNGVDLARFAPGDRAAARARLGLPADGRLVLGVGRLVAGKGFEHAARALHLLPEDVALVVVGDGPRRAALRRAAPPGRLHLLGARGRDAVAEAFRACDVFTLPSAREGWPNVVTEALASGLPVVATPVGGIPEILADPVAGELVPAEPAALAAAISRQLARGDQRAAIAQFARRWSWDEPIARLRTVLREVR